MHSTIEERRFPVPSIASVYRPIEEYWETSRPVGWSGTEASAALNPLDAFLVHRLLELAPGRPVLIDAANAGTGGVSSLIGVYHPRVRAVWAVADPESVPSRRALAALRDHLGGEEDPRRVPLEIIGGSELPERLVEQRGAVILADVRAGDATCLAEDIDRWLDARADALVLVLGLGRVGDCPAIASLLSLCPPGSAKRLRLLRELSEVLMSSRLGIVARRDHPDIAGVLERLEQFYTGNYRYLGLLWRTNFLALREANLDADALRAHWSFGAISQEIEGLKRAAHEAEERAAAATRALAEATGAVDPLLALRRRLSPTFVGRAWRLGKRLRVNLSPTQVGRAYRLTKRVVRACVPRGR
jgi:hypothetical protein